MEITILRRWAGMELKSTGIGGDDSEIYVNGRGVNEIYGDRCAFV